MMSDLIGRVINAVNYATNETNYSVAMFNRHDNHSWKLTPFAISLRLPECKPFPRNISKGFGKREDKILTCW